METKTKTNKWDPTKLKSAYTAKKTTKQNKKATLRIGEDTRNRQGVNLQNKQTAQTAQHQKKKTNKKRPNHKMGRRSTIHRYFSKDETQMALLTVFDESYGF